MRIEQLHYLVEIAKCHSISIAAERLHITQPTMSIAVKNLETEFGEKLFLRSKNGVFLTELGQMLLNDAQIIIDAEKNICEKIKQWKGQIVSDLEGSLSVAVIPAISQAVFETMLPVFSKRYPEVKVFMLEDNPAHVVESVKMQQCDVGFFVADANMIKNYVSENCFIQHLFTEKIYAVMNATTHLAQKSSLSFEDLKDIPLSTTYFDNQDDLMNTNVFDQHMSMNIVLKTNNINILKEHILNGSSVGVVLNSTLVKMPLPIGMVAIPLHFPSITEFCCIYHKENRCQRLIDVFVQMVMEFS